MRSHNFRLESLPRELVLRGFIHAEAEGENVHELKFLNNGPYQFFMRTCSCFHWDKLLWGDNDSEKWGIQGGKGEA